MKFTDFIPNNNQQQQQPFNNNSNQKTYGFSQSGGMKFSDFIPTNNQQQTFNNQSSNQQQTFNNQQPTFNNQSNNQSYNQSNNQSSNQSNNQSNNQSYNQSNNQSNNTSYEDNNVQEDTNDNNNNNKSQEDTKEPNTFETNLVNRIKDNNNYKYIIKKSDIYNNNDFVAKRYKDYLQIKYRKNMDILGIDFSTGPFFGRGNLLNFINNPDFDTIINKDIDYKKVGILISDIYCNNTYNITNLDSNIFKFKNNNDLRTLALEVFKLYTNGDKEKEREVNRIFRAIDLTNQTIFNN